jgi:putative spermidine/putrescine transport system ATP-binding protein
VSALGRIAEVVYIGPDTRYVVTLDVGAELLVTEQNLHTSSSEALAARGRSVRLVWKRRHCRPIDDGRPGMEEGSST